VKLTTGNLNIGICETPAGTPDAWGNRQNDDGDPFNYNPAGWDWAGAVLAKSLILDAATPVGFDDFYLGNRINVRWEMAWISSIRGADYNRYLDEAAEHVAAAQ